MRHDFSTDTIRPPDRLGAWQSIVDGACVPLSVRVPQWKQFEGLISSRDVDELCLSVVQCVGHEGDHNKSQVSRTADDVLLVSVQMAGQGQLEQDGRSTVLSANEMVLYDATRPFRWHFPSSWRQYVVRIPRAQLKFRLNTPNAYTARRLPCGSGLGKVAADFLGSLFDQADSLDMASAKRLSDCAVDLVCGALASITGGKAGPRTNIQALHLNQACSYIAENIREPDLNPEMIARAMKISLRYLHHLFNLNGMSVSRYILQKRLHACARELEHTFPGNTSISAIAYAWGFNSPVHFSRVFRAEYGMSAKEYRDMNVQRRQSGAP